MRVTADYFERELRETLDEFGERNVPGRRLFVGEEGPLRGLPVNVVFAPGDVYYDRKRQTAFVCTHTCVWEPCSVDKVRKRWWSVDG